MRNRSAMSRAYDEGKGSSTRRPAASAACCALGRVAVAVRPNRRPGGVGRRPERAREFSLAQASIRSTLSGHAWADDARCVVGMGEARCA